MTQIHTQIHTQFEATRAKVATESLEAWVSRNIAEQVQKHPPGTTFASTLSSSMIVHPDGGVVLAASMDFHAI